ncbi:plasmid mobilization protein [Mesorhizobium sp. M8A.F.Ca.ET.182.01.1.1]|uniref:plasmid mobilization protein n=1 Tax=Mesorhizobium sp. M8A.F.Ca.ET.182.01.1.1 TaxID=2563964 RepID=UPI001093660F|nr:plasmid mobilization relaxosome protein MobC [Mesorhizobium sp. M8A.F.Ca.ET.182.01.1.1]TGS40706.1 plasmid mobilization relaxosome protein MobC [Mesorhizobium sp. M8A.F.Ca.ET.182.01.1.1]TGS78817.1 plasmid mobilization relaxosome protein MobC [Mesorhizobium sp. M8A.F.Ca.ET.181.01.1.1]
MTATTTIRLTADERAALDAAASAAGLGPCSYARQAVMAAVGRATTVRRRPDGLARAIARLLGEAGRIGNNVNQMARHAHQGGRIRADELAALRTELARLTAAVLAHREPR